MACHLTLQERELLDRLMKKRKSRAEIAELMGQDRSTIYRERSRNTKPGGYQPERAPHWADKRRLACRRSRRLDESDRHVYVRERRENRCSPAQIAGRRQCDYPHRRSRGLSPRRSDRA
jgi:IS30 family transposase